MMNEWGLPTVPLESTVCGIARRLRREGLELPSMVITGGFATEDQVFKALALGAPCFQAVGLCRAAMAAANSAKKVGELIEAGNIPAYLQNTATARKRCSRICRISGISTARRRRASRPGPSACSPISTASPWVCATSRP